MKPPSNGISRKIVCHFVACYIEWNGGQDGVHLYDLATDPHELVNLAGQESCLSMQRRLKRLLAEHLESVSH